MDMNMKMGRDLLESGAVAATAQMERTMDRRRALRLMLGVGAATVAGGVSLARGGSAEARSGPGQLRTTAPLNLRAQPNTGAKVLLVMPQGAVVTNHHTFSQSGFLKVTYQGTTGWAHGNYLVPHFEDEGPTYFTTTTAVNLRAKPSTSAKILLVVPAGKTVADYDLAPTVNGYRGVDYNGTVGWIYDAYLV